MHRAILTVILGFIFWGCPGDGPLDAWAPPDSGYDGGVPSDTGILPDTGVLPDRDGDNIADDLDNCPDVPNTDQADGDQDNVGDVCDGCPQTPNGATQDLCQTVAESEPNEDPASAVALGPFAVEGAAVELIGELEARTGTQAVDTYKITVTEPTRLRLQLKPTPSSVFQPGAVVTGRNYQYPREGAHAEAVARDLVFILPGDYYLRIVDQRWLASGAIHGGANYGYLLQLERTPLAVEALEVGWETNITEHTFALLYPGEVKIFRNNFGISQWFVDIETDHGRGRNTAGYDLLLSTRAFPAMGSPVVHEVAGRPPLLDPYLVATLVGEELIVLDIQKMTGPPGPITLTAGRLPQDVNLPRELEPNDDLANAQPIRMSIRGELTSGPPDTDWFTFEANAQKFLSLSVSAHKSRSFPQVTIGEVVDGAFIPVRRATPETSGYRFGIVPQRTGRYAVRVFDADTNNSSYQYLIALSEQPLLTLFSRPMALNETFEAVLSDDGLYRVLITEPSRLQITLTSTGVDADLQMELYNPPGTRRLVHGSPQIVANIPDSPEPYLFRIYNNHRSLEIHRFRVDVQATPQ